jgi:hypothetical protein
VNAPLFVLAEDGLGGMLMFPVRWPGLDEVPLVLTPDELVDPPLLPELELLPPELVLLLPPEEDPPATAAPPPPVSAVLC